MDGNVTENQALNNLKGKIVVIPTIDSTLTKDGQAADAKVVGDRLAEWELANAPVDNLESESTARPLSANQGRVLNEKIVAIGDGATVMYDAETDTLKVLKDGEWVETSLRANTEIMPLYLDGEDYASFVTYAGGVGTTEYGETVTTPTLTKSGEMIVELTNPNDSYMRGCVISSVVDFTGYSKLKFNHTSSATGGNGVTQSQLIIVPTKQTLMTPVSSLVLTNASTKPNVTNEDVVFDVGELSGEYYIAVFMRMWGKVTVKTSIKNMYLE